MRFAISVLSMLLFLPLGARAQAPADPDLEDKGEKEARAQKQAGARPLRIVSYNIHHAEGTDGKFDLERIAKVIKEQRPDLVAVQEVDVKTRRSSGIDQAAELAKLTGMHYAFGRFMDYRDGEYGQMVLSKFPILMQRNLALPKGPEPRAALVIDVEVPCGDSKVPMTLVACHFYATEAERSAQAQRVIEHLKPEIDAGKAIVLAGDLNSTPGSKPMEILTEHWTDPTARIDRRTWPSIRPRVEIDHILYRPAARFEFVKSKVIVEKVASDHRPVVTVLELKGE